MKWLCILAFATSTALAQTYPAKPVRVIVPFPPGGTAALLTRTTAQKLSASLGQQFVVESRAGAGGNLGAEFVFRAEPDGYTLLASPPHLLTVNPLRGVSERAARHAQARGVNTGRADRACPPAAGATEHRIAG